MTTNTATDNLDADLETLRAFATRRNYNGGLTPLVHTCTAALGGDVQALWMVEGALDALEEYQLGDRTADSLERFLRLVDCERPDGLVARSLEAP